jgi:predicted RNA-binding protein with RPS1 domain
VRILDAVRNIILNWALNLEDQGILGEGLAFSENEKKAAIQISQNINYFYGPVQSSQLAQGNQHVIQISSNFVLDKEAILKFIEKLQAAIRDIELDSAKKLELESEMTTLQAQMSSPNPKKSIVKESLLSIMSILQGAAGSVVGQLLIEAGKILFG